MRTEWIGLLDCNNFFVSCERLFRPDLEGKPVVVMSSNDGCIVARSKEVKDIGVPMSVPYFQVKDNLNKIGTKAFSSHFALYRDISRRVFAVMREELDEVEQYSVDEAFFAVEGNPEELAIRLKQTVEARVGIPVSVGIARTKTLAKYANLLAKKGSGTYHLTDNNWHELQVGTPLQSIWGVGGKTELTYKKHGILTASDLLKTDNGIINKLFGVAGSRLQAELSGQAVLKLGETKSEQKSIMSSRSFSKETEDMVVIKDAVAYHLRQALTNLRRIQCKTGLIRVHLLTSRHGDFLLRGGSAERCLSLPSNESRSLLAVANELIEEIYEPGVPYKKVGISLQNLFPDKVSQSTLFESNNDNDKSESWQAVDELISKLNQKGRDTILLGSRLKEGVWQAKKESRSPAYTTSWEDIAEVKA